MSGVITKQLSGSWRVDVMWKSMRQVQIRLEITDQLSPWIVYTCIQNSTITITS